MTQSFTRRAFLLGASALSLGLAYGSRPTAKENNAQAKLARLDKELGGRLGVYALDTGSGAQIGFRADERFALNSTFKVVLVGAILKRSEREAGLLGRRISYNASNLVTYSPVTEKHLQEGMTVAELCAAGIQYSDNTAANLLMRMLGGPAQVTAFARSVGNETFRLDRWETALNSAIPGDPRDTSTPRAMGRTLQKLAVDDGLKPSSRRQLQDWMRGNTTGDARIRVGVPEGWIVGDKTGTGDYGAANDIAVLWPPKRAPIVLAIYTTGREKDAKARSDVIAAAARVVAEWAR